MVKIIILQTLYNVSDPELEFALNDRISFQQFIGLDNPVPDYSTIWRFKERLTKAGIAKQIHEQFLQQVHENGYVVKTGMIQDATFIEADIGKKRQTEEQKKKKQNKEIRYSRRQKSHINTDATFSKKGAETHHGYKLHTKVDVDNVFIQDFETTTAKVSDNKVDLSSDDDKRMFRDKGYVGTPLKAENVQDFTMKRAARNRPLTEEEKKFNKIVSRIRVKVEWPYASIKRKFNRGRTRATKLIRVAICQMFSCLTYNIMNFISHERKRLADAS
jgi:IS5 family transposase